MALRHLLVAALAACAALAADDDCQCIKETQIIDSITSPMIFFQQPTIGGATNGKTCSMPCTFKASFSGGEDKYSLQVQLLSSKLGDGTLNVKGMNGTLVIGSGTAPQVFTQRSVGNSITIDFTEGATNLGEFMLVVQKMEGVPKYTTDGPTTEAPVTLPFDKIFHNNPLLVANDIMLAFDLSSSNLSLYKKFATDLIGQLTINPKSLDKDAKEDCGVGSRLSVVGLSALAFDNLYAPYWTTTDVQAIGNINSMVQIGSGNFVIDQIAAKYIEAFSDVNDDVHNNITTCKNRGKIFILLTSAGPAGFPDAPVGVTKIPFIDNGVHPILVAYNMGDVKPYYTAYGTDENRWNTFQLTATDSDIPEFFNNYLVNSDVQMTCQTSSADQTVKVGITEKIVQIPPYYNGLNGDTGSPTTWTTPKHYCNFQRTTVNLIPDDGVTPGTPICLTVYYDLETGKDFVSIYYTSNGASTEIVRLTGRDVSGTKFQLDDASGSIVFTSDEKTVYDGFYAKIEKC